MHVWIFAKVKSLMGLWGDTEQEVGVGGVLLYECEDTFPNSFPTVFFVVEVHHVC